MVPTMDEMVTRKCEACGFRFEVRRGSLKRVCREELCVKRRRRARNREERAVAREREELDAIRDDDRVQAMWPEIVAILQAAADMGKPTKADLAYAVKLVCRSEGPLGLRSALIELSAIAMRWAAALPRKNVIEPNHDRPSKKVPV